MRRLLGVRQQHEHASRRAAAHTAPCAAALVAFVVLATASSLPAMHVASAARAGLRDFGATDSQPPPPSPPPSESAGVLNVMCADATDCTDELQSALNSTAAVVRLAPGGVPGGGGDTFITRPLFMRGGQGRTLLLEPGVELLAKRGEFHGTGDSLLTFLATRDVTVSGYGASLRMWKQDYANGTIYKKAEWRMGLSFRGCTGVTVKGVTIRATGGDGLYFDGYNASLPATSGVHVKDVVADDNYRQGMSLISVRDLLCESTVFSNTSGTPPAAGIDMEPDSPAQRMHNVTIRNVTSRGNQGHGFLVHLRNFVNYTSVPASEAVSIVFDNCTVDGAGASGLAMGAVAESGPAAATSSLAWRNIVVQGTQQAGIKVYAKAASAMPVSFANVTLRNTGLDASQPLNPIAISNRYWPMAVGGIRLEGIDVFDHSARVFLNATANTTDTGVRDVTGSGVTVYNPVAGGCAEAWGPHAVGCSVEFTCVPDVTAGA